VIVRAPRLASRDRIEALLRDKADWIARARAKALARAEAAAAAAKTGRRADRARRRR